MDHAMMRPAKAVMRQDCVGLGGEVAIREEQQFDPLANLLVAEVRGLGGRRLLKFYVSHIDIFRKDRYNAALAAL
jgi:hypothetical protein